MNRANRVKTVDIIIAVDCAGENVGSPGIRPVSYHTTIDVF